MAGKGQRRREKNYRMAHGGNNRLPPPPNLKELEAVPAKLRKIMQFKNPASSAPGSNPRDSKKEQKKGADSSEKKGNKKKTQISVDIGKQTSSKYTENTNLSVETNSNNASKRKRKRKAANDLRFQNIDGVVTRSIKKERRKEYLKAKKRKQKEGNTNDVWDFPQHEEIKFGEIVEAPPKLSFPKKTLKTSMDASRERFRLEAIEAYRNQRGWASRPGVQLPILTEGTSLQ